MAVAVVALVRCAWRAHYLVSDVAVDVPGVVDAEYVIEDAAGLAAEKVVCEVQVVVGDLVGRDIVGCVKGPAAY
ncbi:hypothetical protein ACIQU1_20200 [Streptomyces angustmyceticus]|uniref:hypothetical protein n=1 Tax=Streptomyces angustmyceticus TaxID=285578 RepID=UPI00380EAC91